MITVSAAKRIPASADRLWRMISTAELRDNIASAYLDGVDVEGEGVGAVLTIRMKSGVTLKERIDRLDPVEREFGYSVVDSGPLNYAYYTSIMRVQPCGPDESLISVRCNFIVEDGRQEETTAAWYANNENRFNLIYEFFKSGQG